MHRTGKPIAFFNLQGFESTHWLMQPFQGRLYFWETQSAVWPKLFDGIFFIDTMTPSTPVPNQ
jgi:erythromycin esterase-like protein